MTYENIKHLSIRNYLNSKGIYPKKEYTGYGMYRSPFREESSPSFKVDFNQNLWYDFGSNEGGSIIDLVMKMNNFSLKEAYEHLSKYKHKDIQALPYSEKSNSKEDAFSFHRDSPNTGITLLGVKPLSHPKLLEYLQDRRINLNIAKSICDEVIYEIKERKYFAIGFKNYSGGYEIRNAYFKGCISPKEITIISNNAQRKKSNNVSIQESEDSVMHISMNTCTQVYKKDVMHRHNNEGNGTYNHVHNNTSTINLFEGFMDYLSLLTLQPSQANVSAVVLNSVSNFDRAIPFLSKHSKINSFLDNDDAGRAALKKLQSLKLPVEDISGRYSNFKDLNDYLYHKKHAVVQRTPIQNMKRGLKF
ncbi:MAG: hypothetical protein GXZ03_02125 [Proteiniphilum sp.]|nr:hypothetical protein [Proteiniphilum sp.]